MRDKVETLQKEFEKSLKAASQSSEIENLRVHFLGRKGPIVSLMEELKQVPSEERPAVGRLINDLKMKITTRLEEAFDKLAQGEIEDRLKTETIDVSLPGRKNFLGRSHPISQMIERVVNILSGMGFSAYLTPEIESDYYNYAGLNYPEDHPARDMQDTYYLDEKTLLRSHTTNFQQRVMENYNPPIRMMCFGKCYRNETISSRSHVIFHQIDVMYVDKGVTMGDLIASMKEFYSKLFNESVELRLRASYFPFVEPGMEVDIKCTLCKGKGCRLCKNSGWLEVCGAGMIHPEVLKGGGLDDEVYSGFAWGGGIERPSLLLHGINDIRLFLENDLRFLEQFP